MIKKSFLLLLLVLVVLWFLFQRFNDTNEATAVSIGSEGLIITNEKEKNNHNKLLPKARLTEVELADPDEIIILTTNESKPIENSYMDLYHKSLLTIDCDTVYTDISQGNIEVSTTAEELSAMLLEKYHKEMSSFSYGLQSHPTTIQTELFSNHVNECLLLLDEMEIGYDRVNKIKVEQMYDEFMRMLHSTEPKTPEEKELKKVLLLKHGLRKDLITFETLNSGMDNSNEEQLEELGFHLVSFQYDINSAKFFSEEARKSEEYQELKQKIEFIKDDIAELEKLDEPAIKRIQYKIISTIAELKLMMHTDYPDVFFEVIKGLNFDEYSPNITYVPHIQQEKKDVIDDYQLIAEELYGTLQIKDVEYFNQLLPVSIEMYRCFLRDDCSSTNHRTVKRLCFLPTNFRNFDLNGIHQQSCEISLQAFYLEHFLTVNQAQDMMMIFDYLVSSYAQ